MHVREPGAVLAEARRVLRPGARIAVWEPDFESLLFDLDDVETSRTVAIVAGDRLAQGRVGRRLGRLLIEAGFVDVDVVPEPGWARSFADLRRIFSFDAVVASAVTSYGAAPDRMAAWLLQIETREGAGTFWMTFARFFASARA